MKNLKLLGLGLFFALSQLACTSSDKSGNDSDSAVMAPVDTLGGDTTQHNSFADSSATSGADTTENMNH